jgi:hypothetical protein
MASRRQIDSAFAAEVNSSFGDRGMCAAQPSRVEVRADLHDFVSADRQTQQY